MIDNTRYCRACHRELTKDETGTSQKMLGRDTRNYYCLDCMASSYEVSVDWLLEKIEEWKEAGCELF